MAKNIAIIELPPPFPTSKVLILVVFIYFLLLAINPYIKNSIKKLIIKQETGDFTGFLSGKRIKLLFGYNLYCSL